MPRTKYTILQFADRVERLAKNLNKAILPPFRRDLKIMQRALYAEYWESPFGARIWKWTTHKFMWTTSARSGASILTGRKSGPSVHLGKGSRRKYARWSVSQGAYIGQLNIEGMAAKMELGGRLRKHVFWNKGEREPGVGVPRHRRYEKVIENKLFPRLVDNVSKDFWKFVEREL